MNQNELERKFNRACRRLLLFITPLLIMTSCTPNRHEQTNSVLEKNENNSNDSSTQTPPEISPENLVDDSQSQPQQDYLDSDNDTFSGDPDEYEAMADLLDDPDDDEIIGDAFEGTSNFKENMWFYYYQKGQGICRMNSLGFHELFLSKKLFDIKSNFIFSEGYIYYPMNSRPEIRKVQLGSDREEISREFPEGESLEVFNKEYFFSQNNESGLIRFNFYHLEDVSKDKHISIDEDEKRLDIDSFVQDNYLFALIISRSDPSWSKIYKVDLSGASLIYNQEGAPDFVFDKYGIFRIERDKSMSKISIDGKEEQVYLPLGLIDDPILEYNFTYSITNFDEYFLVVECYNDGRENHCYLGMVNKNTAETFVHDTDTTLGWLFANSYLINNDILDRKTIPNCINVDRSPMALILGEPNTFYFSNGDKIFSLIVEKYLKTDTIFNISEHFSYTDYANYSTKIHGLYYYNDCLYIYIKSKSDDICGLYYFDTANNFLGERIFTEEEMEYDSFVPLFLNDKEFSDKKLDADFLYFMY